nr:hypothetical protein [Tanacetum cinerariifolium]
MDEPNITIEEYIMFEEEKARKCRKVFNWETAKYGKIWYDEDVHDHISVETEFPVIVFNDNLISDKTLSCEPTISSFNDNEIDFRISFDEFDDEDYTYSAISWMATFASAVVFDGEKVVGLIEMMMLMETHEEGEMMEHVDGSILGWMGWERSISSCSEVECVFVVECLWDFATKEIVEDSWRVSNLHTARSSDSAYNSHESPRNSRPPKRTAKNGSHVDGADTEPSIIQQDSFEMRLPELPKIDLHSFQRQASHGTDPDSTVIPLTGDAIFGSCNLLLAYMIALVVTKYHRNESNKHMRNEVDKWGEDDIATILCNEVGWFDEEENSVDTLSMRLANNATFMRAAFSNRLSIFIQDLIYSYHCGVSGRDDLIVVVSTNGIGHTSDSYSFCHCSAILCNEVGWFDEEENSVDTLSMRLENNATFVRAAFSNRISIFIQDLIYSYHCGVSGRDDLIVVVSTNGIGHTSDSYSFYHCSGVTYTSIMNTSVIMQQLAFYLIIISSEHFCHKL